MANLLDEELLPFASAIRSLPGAPHISTGYRFAMRGIRGVVLETVRVGGKRYTSRQALNRFIEKVTAATTPNPKMGPMAESVADPQVDQRLKCLGL